MMGIVGNSLRMMQMATGNSQINNYLGDLTDWMRRYGMYRQLKGLYYARGFANCEPDPTLFLACKGSDGDGANRFYAGEIFGLLSWSYLANRDENVRQMGDELMGSNFGKIGFGGPETSEGWFTGDIDDNGFTYAVKRAKDFGFIYGFGFASTWPAARKGGVDPPRMIDAAVPVDPANVPEGTTLKVVVLAPNGLTTTHFCQSADCSVPMDNRIGDHLAKVHYLDSNGNERRTSEEFILFVQP